MWLNIVPTEKASIFSQEFKIPPLDQLLSKLEKDPQIEAEMQIEMVCSLSFFLCDQSILTGLDWTLDETIAGFASHIP